MTALFADLPDFKELENNPQSVAAKAKAFGAKYVVCFWIPHNNNEFTYDNAKKAFFNTWIDNMGTGMMTMEGQYNEATKSIEMSGKEVDPVSGKELKVREVIKFIDNDNHTLEMYMTPLVGKEYKNMEIKLTRRQMPVPSANPVTPTPVAPIKPAEKK